MPRHHNKFWLNIDGELFDLRKAPDGHEAEIFREGERLLSDGLLKLDGRSVREAIDDWLRTWPGCVYSLWVCMRDEFQIRTGKTLSLAKTGLALRMHRSKLSRQVTEKAQKKWGL